MKENMTGNIEATIDYQRDLTVQTVKGAVSGQDIIESINTYYTKKPTRLILWDFSEASLEKIKTDEVALIAKLTQKYSGLREGGKTALVFSSESGFGLGRMFDIHQEIEDSTISYMSFRNGDEALKWLGVTV